MGKEQKDSKSTTAVDKSLRPALIVSERTISEYSIFLEHLLVGLADESIPVALVCPPGYDAESVITPSVEVINHPAFELPILWRQSRKKLIERLDKFKPSLLH